MGNDMDLVAGSRERDDGTSGQRTEYELGSRWCELLRLGRRNNKRGRDVYAIDAVCCLLSELGLVLRFELIGLSYDGLSGVFDGVVNRVVVP